MLRYSLCLVTFFALLQGPNETSAQSNWQSFAEIPAPEAFQAAAADEEFVYAISSKQVAKYDRGTGKRIALSSGEAQHLNSGFLWQDQLLLAHSNYPKTPEKSEIKSLDLESMDLSTFHDFGNYGGSLVWVVRNKEDWWCNFAKYGEKNFQTFLVRFDQDWKETGRWTYPKTVIRELGGYSLSGGLWAGNELLATGHDKPKLYRLRLPKAGRVLEFVGRDEVPFSGQGFAIDGATGGLVGIHRAQQKVIFVSHDEDSSADSIRNINMPVRGICAHRGASDTHPENTLVAFREAIRLGAHMIEFDVALTKDEKLVLLHDSTLDRTTDGRGPVSALTLSELKELDAGSWKNDRYKDERIPTLDEALAIMPDNIWLNVHLKGNEKLAEEVTKRIVATERLHQSFLACGQNAASAAKTADSRIMICNMDRQANSLDYVNETIKKRSEFIQLYGGKSVDAAHTQKLKEHGIRINFCCANDAAVVAGLFKAGVEFPLVDRLEAMLKVADRQGVPRLKPVFRQR
ncbi:MAG: glycerophosphodiester phosphodiesterase family protein [Planctomycetota bacterium]